jgi:hypothetical protein
VYNPIGKNDPGRPEKRWKHQFFNLRVVVGYQRFRGLCCLHLQGEVAVMRENGIDIPGLERGGRCC